MSRTSWHVTYDGQAVTVSRRARPVFDVAGETMLPDACRVRIAHQVRQDLWRALQNVRGFAPAVQIERHDTGLHVTAGGQLACSAPVDQLRARIQHVLDDPQNRLRWVTYGRKKKAVH